MHITRFEQAPTYLLDASPIEKIYFVVEGELTVETPVGKTSSNHSTRAVSRPTRRVH